MAETYPRPEPRRPGRPRKLYAKADPRYEPTRAELEEDIGVPNITPEEIARIMFAEARRDHAEH